MTKKYETIKVSDIIPYEKNPRKNDEASETVKKSIEQCGYITPIIIDENNIILAGHTRLKALQKIGTKQVDVIRVKGLTESQKKKFRILDNKTNELAEWDLDILSEEIDGLDFGDIDLNFGINEIDIEDTNDFDLGVGKKLLKCPVCGHINEEKAFKNYEDTE